MPTTQDTRKQIEQSIDLLLADNSSQDITAADLRSIVKNSMTSSMYAPIMIYSGIIKHDEGSGTADVSIKELYFNPDFFAKQLASDPTNSYNIYKLSSINATGAADGTFSYQIPGGSGEGLVLNITTASNLVTAMEVGAYGAGYKVGDVMSFNIGTTTLSITYQGAIRHNTSATFDITTNTDQTYLNHKENNTIISATPVDANVGGGEVFDVQNEITSPNVIQIKLDTGNTYDDHYQHVQLYRIAGI